MIQCSECNAKAKYWVGSTASCGRHVAAILEIAFRFERGNVPVSKVSE